MFGAIPTMIGEAAALSKEPRAIDPGLNVSVGASLLGQFGSDNINLERTGERHIDGDQSNATPTRFFRRQNRSAVPIGIGRIRPLAFSKQATSKKPCLMGITGQGFSWMELRP
jgi:hypothetical protein